MRPWQLYMTAGEARKHRRQEEHIHHLRKEIQKAQAIKASVYDKAKYRRRKANDRS